ncbi:MAG: ribosome biogenesis GTPase Der [Zetaproteobacteria bacterium]|nr:ribosome biogenesis GTPase Der [Zetaproteobacteria bacterium]
MLETQKILPVIAIVGRPNVGKSTLFNRLLGQRKAIVGDRPGVTVDRLESDCDMDGVRVMLVDTGGIGETQHEDVMQAGIDHQVEAALHVADAVMFAVDAHAGPTMVDMNIAKKLRRQKIPVYLIVNKAEKPDVALEFYSLGLGDPIPVSAVHGHGIKELMARLGNFVRQELSHLMDEPDDVDPIANISVIGRPNVGKSTLMNTWLGEDRMVVSPIAGTTRDAIDQLLPYGNEGGVVRLVDTAGQRKHGRISDVIEFVARVKAVQAFKRADAAVMVLDGSEGIVEQDMRLMRLAQDEGCSLIVAVNKSDLLSEQEWNYFKERLHFRMRGMTDIPVFKISAQERFGTRKLLDEAVKASKNNHFTLGTGELNRWLEDLQEHMHAPSDDGNAVRLKYASQVATHPPTFKVFSNRPSRVKASYLRHMEQSFRKAFNLPGVPIRWLFDGSENPYAPKKKRRD